MAGRPGDVRRGRRDCDRLDRLGAQWPSKAPIVIRVAAADVALSSGTSPGCLLHSMRGGWRGTSPDQPPTLPLCQRACRLCVRAQGTDGGGQAPRRGAIHRSTFERARGRSDCPPRRRTHSRLSRLCRPQRSQRLGSAPRAGGRTRARSAGCAEAPAAAIAAQHSPTGQACAAVTELQQLTLDAAISTTRTGLGRRQARGLSRRRLRVEHPSDGRRCVLRSRRPWLSRRR